MRTTIRTLRHTFPLVLALLVAFAPLQGALAQAQDETPQIRITQVDNSQFPKVTLYVSVTNAAGEPVGVDPNQIQILENGKLITPETVSGEGDIGPLTTMLVMDISGSMLNVGKLDSAKAAANAYIEQMRPSDQAGLMAFNTSVEYVQPITNDHATLEAAISSLKAHDDPAMYDALDQAVSLLKGIPGRKAIIVLTDGLDNVSKFTAEQVIQAIGPGGLSISTIGLGDPGQLGDNSGLDEAGLRSLADRAGGVYGYANDPDSLRALYELYSRALQSEYTITYTSPLTLRDGANRTLTVQLSEVANSAPAQAKYNPGGVLPEVAQNVSWPVFGLILGGLLILFFVPGLFNRAMHAVGGPKRGGRVKLNGQSSSHKANIKLK
jgi:VWFA-related protein